MITASVVKSNAIKKVPIVLPHYLADIFAAIKGDRYFDVVGRIDYHTQPAFFEFYKVKDLKNLKRLFKDFRVISRFAKRRDKAFLLDYRSRRLFFTKASFMWPSVSENIYDGKRALLGKNSFLDNSRGEHEAIQPVSSGINTRMLILPDSRIASKKIDDLLVKKITEDLANIHAQVAYFSTTKAPKRNALQYANFEELISLISSYDLIISAESLPYHLANYLNKPHFVIYNESRHYKSNFMTPFMLQHTYYAIYNGKNSDDIVQKLSRILFGNVNQIA
jgi:hypothetical protein